MKSLRPLLAVLPVLMLHANAADEAPSAVFNLTNGDRLTGVPDALDEKGHLLVQSATNLADAASFKTSALLDVQLPSTAQRPPASAHQAVLKLTNGDTIRGQLSALDDEHITLDSWYGGTLKIRRCMSRDLEVLRSEKHVYSGPDSLENWTAYGEDGSWSFNNGQFISSGEGGLAREFDLPNKVHFSFQIAWRNSLKFRAYIFANEGDNSSPENCYDLVCQRRFVYLRKRWLTNNKNGNNNGGNDNIGRPANIPELAQNERVRLDLYIDRETGNFSFYVDGKQSQVWTDTDPGAGEMGNWLHIVSEDEPMRISRIEASAWSGDLPDEPGAEPEDPPLEEEGQIIRLQNGDDLVGEVQGIEDGVLTLKTKWVDNIRVPVDRMRTIDLSVPEDDQEKPRLMKGDIRAWLRDGGFITFQLKSFADGKLTGYSQTFGSADFNLNAFSRLEFNIHQEALNALRDTDAW